MAPISQQGQAVYCTLLMTDDYLPGAMTLGHSLRDRGGAKMKLAVLVTVDSVSADSITELKTIYDDIIPVQQIQNKQPANLYVMNRPDLISTFTKIELWKQTQFKRIVYLDADMVVLKAPNELLRMDTQFAAVPDIGWPDCFNSGLMVLNPNMGDYFSLLALAQRGISFDGADQGLLNMHFGDWERLSFTYNCTPSGNYQYVPAYRHFSSSIRAVHFIGPDKPWTLGRENRFNAGVYGELLGMWWTVYDRHYRTQGSSYYSGQSVKAPHVVQSHVRGEESTYLPGYSSVQPPEQAIIPPPVEESMGDTSSPGEKASQDDIEPTPTVEQRRFSAPHSDWEPSRAPPPLGSKPEASNFPTQTYYMSSDTHLFQPPSRYPDAPRGMYYEVPTTSAEVARPTPIFPWEKEGRAPKPTRVFAQPREPSPPPALQSTAEPETTSATIPGDAMPGTISSPDTWATFQSRSNAWDDIPEIEKYMQGIQQPRRGKIQVLHHTPSEPGTGTSPLQTPPGRERKPSLKITDFPTEVERPSLPVTPAPIRRPSFWGFERDDQGNLPSAEGVPKQEDWNPIEKLEELQRRQSEVMMTSTKLNETTDLPTRQMPESDNLDAAIAADVKATSPTEVKPKPILKKPTFGIPKDGEQVQDEASSAAGPSTTGDAKQDVLSPTSDHVELGNVETIKAETINPAVATVSG